MKEKYFLLSLILSMVLMSVGSVAAALAETTESWGVIVGKATDDGVSLDSMFPKVAYIHVGDTITFTNGAAITPHTVTFLAGAAPLSPEDPKSMAPNAPSGAKWNGKTLLTSGILEPGKQYTITFTSSGAFSYYCVLHPLMTGTVVVLPAGEPIPSKAEQAAKVKAETDDLIEQANSLRSAKHEVHAVKNENGTITYQMETGVGHRGFSVNRMLPETLFISEGDAVEWLNDNHYEPHFITFNKPADLNFFLPGGAFHPTFMAPAGGTSFDGTGFTNSGLIPPMKSYKLTFTKPGTYQYECYLHSGDKMTGTIQVAPKDTIKVLVNGKPLLYNYKPPHIHNNHVYVGLDAFAEALGGTAVHDKARNAVILNIGGQFPAPLELKSVGDFAVVVNGKQLLYGFEPAPHLHDGRHFAPVQELVSLSGGSYSWDEATKTFAVTLENHTTSHIKH